MIVGGEVKITGEPDAGKCESGIAAAVGFGLVDRVFLAEGRDAEHAGVCKTLQPPLAPDAHGPQLFGFSCR